MRTYNRGAMVTANDLLPALVSVLTEALHNLDSALLVAQEVPDWRQKYREAKDNPLRKEQTDRLIALLEEVSNAILENRLDDPDFQLRLEQLTKALCKPPD